MTLKNEANLAQYVSDCLILVDNIDSLDQRGMQNTLTKAVNKQLKAAGVPKVTTGEDINSQSNAEFDFTTWKITFGAPLMVAGSLTALRLGVNTVYHEARHCEQWYRMAQGVAAGKLNKNVQNRIDHKSAADIAAKLWIPLNIAQAAMSNTDYGGNTDREVLAWWDSVYAKSGGIRNRKLGHIQERYDAYRNLPEEIDAWHLGDSAEEDFAARCPKLGCPTYAYWKKQTAVWYLPRSTELKSVDTALKAYDLSKSAKDRSTLKQNFDTWYGPKLLKGGTARAIGNNNAVTQLKSFVDQFNDQGTQGVQVMAQNNELLEALKKRKQL